jgi:hypothetical protein
MSRPAEVASNVEVVVFALYVLGGATRKLHTEDIALEAFRLAPDRFSWRRHKGYPDKDIVRVSLVDAARKEKGQFVVGRSGKPSAGKEEDGWQLTPAGAKWAATNAERLHAALRVGTASPSHRDIDRIRSDVRRSALFRHWAAGSLTNASTYDFTDFLGSSPDALPQTIAKRFDRIRTAAEAAQDEELIRFLQTCRARFASLFGE